MKIIIRLLIFSLIQISCNSQKPRKTYRLTPKLKKFTPKAPQKKSISCSVYGLLGFKMFYGKEFQTIVKQNFKDNKWTVHYMKIKINPEYIQQFLGSINRNDTKIDYTNLGKYKYLKSREKINILTPPLGDNSYKYEVDELFVKKNKIYGKIRIFEKIKEFEFYEIE